MVSVHAERTFERLRYLFGGDRPSQTAHLTMSPSQFHGCRLEFQHFKSGIPKATPQKLTPLLLSLPPILYMKYQNPILSYSKAPWGLSVLSRVTGIFTGTTISPGGLLRQCPDRYTIRAGQNLPDKEFRYLRTVIVTAAVYWGFNSMLAHLLLTFQHYGRRLLGLQFAACTTPLNLPAPGRCQPVYVIFRFSTDLCFC